MSLASLSARCGSYLYANLAVGPTLRMHGGVGDAIRAGSGWWNPPPPPKWIGLWIGHGGEKPPTPTPTPLASCQTTIPHANCPKMGWSQKIHRNLGAAQETQRNQVLINHRI